MSAYGKKVAIVGFATLSRDGVKDSDADEIWSMNWAWKYDFIPRIDRLFEMHSPAILSLGDRSIFTQLQYALKRLFDKTLPIDPARSASAKKLRDQWQWLQQPHDFPVYMQTKLPKCPAAVEYPFEAVARYCWSNLWRGKKRQLYFTSSFDFMMALAIYEQVAEIQLYGIELGSDTEYKYQRPGGHAYIGMALGKGIKVVLPESSYLFNADLYGYRKGQVIFRQDLEHHARIRAGQAEEYKSKLNSTEGKYAEVTERFIAGTATQAELDEAFMNLKNSLIVAGYSVGALNGIKELIRDVDLLEPEFEIELPFEQSFIDGN